MEEDFFETANVLRAVEILQQRKTDIARYRTIQQWTFQKNVAVDREFQRTFTAFYRVRRDAIWRTSYFNLFEYLKNRKVNVSFEEILQQLFQKVGRIEASFSSKMLATINPDMPIWDSIVLKNLGLKLKGKDKKDRLLQAVLLYEKICCWYEKFLKTDEATEMIRLFDQTFPEFREISRIKKVDFVIWAIR